MGRAVRRQPWLKEICLATAPTGTSPAVQLHHAAENGDSTEVRWFPVERVDANSTAGYTRPLHMAAENWHTTCVMLLLEHHADNNIIHGRNFVGDTSVGYAAEYNQYGNVKLWFDRGARPMFHAACKH